MDEGKFECQKDIHFIKTQPGPVAKNATPIKGLRLEIEPTTLDL